MSRGRCPAVSSLGEVVLFHLTVNMNACVISPTMNYLTSFAGDFEMIATSSSWKINRRQDCFVFTLCTPLSNDRQLTSLGRNRKRIKRESFLYFKGWNDNIRPDNSSSGISYFTFAFDVSVRFTP